jgi:hypothetical protein
MHHRVPLQRFSIEACHRVGGPREAAEPIAHGNQVPRELDYPIPSEKEIHQPQPHLMRAPASYRGPIGPPIRPYRERR